MRGIDELQDESYRHKWWGWGPEAVEYDMHRRPEFWTWIRKTGQLPDDAAVAPRVNRDAIVLPARHANSEFEQSVGDILHADQIRCDDDDRISHSYGRSYRDLIRLLLGAAPLTMLALLLIRFASAAPRRRR